MVERTYNQPARLNPNTGLWGTDEYIPIPAQGAGYTISGTGFGTKNGYSDHINTSGIYDLPVDSNFGVVGRWSGEDFIGASNRPVVKAEGITGNKCLYFFQDVAGAAGREPNNILVYRYDSPVPVGQKIFFSEWIKHSTTSVSGGQLKLHRWQNVENSISDKSNEIYIATTQPAYGDTNQCHIRDFDDGIGGLTLYGNNTRSPNDRNAWVRMDFLITLPVDYDENETFKMESWIYDRDGVSQPLYINYTDNQAVEQANPYKIESSLPTIHVLQKYAGNGDYGISTHQFWSDKIFQSIGDDKRVEFCNSQNWGSQTKSYTQPLASWSDTTVVVESFDRGDLTSGWLHIISNNVSVFSRRLG